MKRIIGIMIGLSLGWIAAGLSFAQEHGQAVVEHAAEGEHHKMAVTQLTENAVAGMPFLPLVLLITASLFGGAVFVHLMGWAKPQPIVEDVHDDHGHDAHHH